MGEINYRDIIHCIDNLGMKLSEVLRNGNQNKRRLRVSFDLIKKMGNNVFILSLIDKSDKSVTSMNLIYRGVILDLMTALFLLHLTESEFEYSYKMLDVSHVRFMREVLPLRLELGRKVCNPQEGEVINEQSLFDQYYGYFRDYLKSERGEPWEIIRPERPAGFAFDGKVKSIYEYLKMCDDNENLEALSNLYMYYKYLSQTEHYSLIGNKYPFKNEHDESWNKECNIAIYAGLCEMDELLKPHY